MKTWKYPSRTLNVSAPFFPNFQGIATISDSLGMTFLRGDKELVPLFLGEEQVDNKVEGVDTGTFTPAKSQGTGYGSFCITYLSNNWWIKGGKAENGSQYPKKVRGCRTQQRPVSGYTRFLKGGFHT